MITTVQRAASNYKLDIKEPSKGGQPLPPASFQRFLRSTRTIPGIVLTDHEDKYKNKWETKTKNGCHLGSLIVANVLKY